MSSARFASVTAADACPCGRAHPSRRSPRPSSYGECCGRWHAGSPAPDAESLMRSRYSAFVLGLHDYLLATWHASTRPTDLTLDPQLKWLGLQVLAHHTVDATHAQVRFVARSRWQGKGQRLEERSRFVLEERRWWYVDGDDMGQPPVRSPL